MKTRATAVLAVAALIGPLPALGSAMTPYSQDFEGLVQSDTAALTNDGWLVFGNVFDGGMNYLYSYGPFGAPNDGAAFCAIAVGEGGPEQGDQQLSVYSDYNNTDHGVGNIIESITYREQSIEASDVGLTWIFDFDAKLGNLGGATTALAFIKVLDPNNGYSTTHFITEDTTAIPTTWGSYSLSLEIDAGLVGQLFQIGFSNNATNYEPSGVFYDNIDLHPDGTATASSTLSAVKALY